MAGVLDLDAVVVETTEIKKTVAGKPMKWALRDDVPPQVMLAVFRAMAHAEKQQREIAALKDAGQSGDPDEIEAAVAKIEQALLAQKSEVAHICGDIFRHSYPETTDDEVRRWFTDEQRKDIVTLFFTRRLQASSQPSSATTEEPTPNRATKRANSKRSSGAIPSQKRLSRAMGM